VNHDARLGSILDGRQALRIRGWQAAARGAAALATAALVVLSSCSSGDLPLEAVDPNAAPLQPSYDQVAVLLQRSCVPCHASGGSPPLPSGEGEEVDYSTCAGTQAGLEGLRRTVLGKGSMPPGAWPRLDEREKLILKRWMDQGACSPCSPCR
jgi:mono/diheme cytochrome c family protein